jgi:D-glycero-beta-D-manno-heptose-7-phosphate kinase
LKADNLIEIARRFKDQRLLVIGDLVADQFVYGEISRVSREAPVFILKHERTETLPGGAGNCALNIADLGGHCSVLGVIGRDETGSALKEKLSSAGVDCQGLVVSAKVRTTTKVRILAGQSHSTRQQVIRVDYDGDGLDNVTRAELLENLKTRIDKADAIIVSDYNYGAATPELTEIIHNLTDSKRVIVDSRFRLPGFVGFTSATPNQDEVESILGKRFEDLDALKVAGEQLRHRLGFQSLLITRGGNGMLLLQNGSAINIDAVGAREPVDVTGAGDTVIATFALALSSGAEHRDAAYLANHAASRVVMKRGTATISNEELISLLMDQHND